MSSRNSKPKVSVIIPAFKRLGYEKEAIESILAQKGVEIGDIQIIVSDDERGKDNRKIFKSIHKEIVYTKNVNEEGPGGNRQSGLRMANGRYVIFLDSDDRLLPKYILEMMKVMEKEKDRSAAICFSRSNFESGFKLSEKIKLYPLIFIRNAGLLTGYLFNDKCIYPTSFYLCQISHMMFRAGAIRGHKFNYDYRHGGEDWDFIIKAQKKGKIRVVPKKLLLFRYSPGSSTDIPKNRKLKWKSYTLLAKRLPGKFKRGIFYKLFHKYISLFGGKNVKK